MDAKQSSLEAAHLERASSDEIRNDIRGTRREMDETLDELGDRLHPRHLLEDVIDLFRSDSDRGGESRQRMATTSRRIGRGIAHQIRQHPLPALLTGVAIARWLYEATEESHPGGRDEELRGYAASDWRSRTGEPDWREKAQGVMEGAKGAAASMSGRATQAASQFGERVSGAASSLGERVAGVASNVSEKVSEAAGVGWEQVRRGGETVSRYSGEGRRLLGERASLAKDRFREVSEEFPLPVGGAFLAAGVLAGLLFPRTEREDDWMGEASDQVKDETLTRGEDLVERGKEIAARAATSAMDEAESRGISPGNLAGKAARVAAEAIKAGKAAAAEEGISPAALKEKAGAVARTAAETAKQEGKKQTAEGKG